MIIPTYESLNIPYTDQEISNIRVRLIKIGIPAYDLTDNPIKSAINNLNSRDDDPDAALVASYYVKWKLILELFTKPLKDIPLMFYIFDGLEHDYTWGDLIIGQQWHETVTAEFKEIVQWRMEIGK